MKTSKLAPKIAGIFFLIAIFTSLLGGGLIESSIDMPNYLFVLSAKTTSITIGVYLEFVTGIAVAGIVISLFPILKKHNETLSLAFMIFRIIESIFCIVSAVMPMLLLSISKGVVNTGSLNTAYIQTLCNLMISVRSNMTNFLIPVFFCLGAFSFYYVLYQSKLIQLYISIWGGIAVVMVLILNLFKIDHSISLFLALPIILNEIYLGIWLIFKGFSLPDVNLSANNQVSVQESKIFEASHYQ